ncbi:uncharacterized protein LOC106664554 [Cimex lectularius]|uniref:Uncharacterized protein n=1 Tax=Cimex lectularius TaxID=79782 RepID=A0A8I6RGL0_CIMLE|nr:uncharacterized protein LOC106664554 [Cimex lectularius]
MSPLKPVRSLYNYAVDQVLKTIYEILKNREKDLEPLRKHLINLLHGGIREHIIDKAVSDYGSSVCDILDIVELLADSSIQELQLLKVYQGHNFQNGELFSRLNNSNIIGLRKLNLKVHVQQSNSPRIELLTEGLHKVLRRGLAANLRVLTLHNGADNQSLSILGKYAEHLTHLDITSSWLVDDTGICDLLLKDVSNFINSNWSDLENCEPHAIKSLSLLPECTRNKVCRTLCEVKIQDTNTSSISVLLLLIFARCLKSLGGFLYSRNIGDAILMVQSLDNAPEYLELTELWDTQLPLDKLTKLAKYLPKLSILYTRAACLPKVPPFLPPLKSLTADFDFVHYGPQLFEFLEFNGSSITRLVLIDQVYSLDLNLIALYCPLLEELVAKVTVDPSRSSNNPMSNLKSAIVRIASGNTFLWIMRQADNIVHLEVLLEREGTEEDAMFENDVIQQMIDENPKSLQSIAYLSIHMYFNPRYQICAVSCGTLTINAAYTLCIACDSLKVLGELHTWFWVSKKDVLSMAEHIKKSNWDVKLRYRDVLYPET